MTTFGKVVLAMVIFAGGLLLAAAYYKRDTIYVLLVEGPAVGMQAPEITLINEDESVVSLSQFKGRNVILHFMAAWCGECQKELPAIQALHDEGSANPDYVLINIAFREDQKETRNFLRSKGYDMPIYGDPTGAAARNYGILVIPAAIVIDASGIIQTKFAGAGRLEKYLAQ